MNNLLLGLRNSGCEFSFKDNVIQLVFPKECRAHQVYWFEDLMSDEDWEYLIFDRIDSMRTGRSIDVNKIVERAFNVMTVGPEGLKRKHCMEVTEKEYRDCLTINGYDTIYEIELFVASRIYGPLRERLIEARYINPNQLKIDVTEIEYLAFRSIHPDKIGMEGFTLICPGLEPTETCTTGHRKKNEQGQEAAWHEITAK